MSDGKGSEVALCSLATKKITVMAGQRKSRRRTNSLVNMIREFDRGGGRPKDGTISEIRQLSFGYNTAHIMAFVEFLKSMISVVQ